MSSRTHDIYIVTFWGTIANLLLTLFKFAAGVLGGSAAMIADAVHSLSDFATDIVVFLFVHIAGKDRDADHRYGHGKYETLGTAVIALLLIVVAIGLAASGIEKVIAWAQGEPLPQPGTIALVAAAVSIVTKEALYHYTAVQGRRLASTTLVANAWHHRSDALSSIGTAAGIAGAIFLGEHWRVLDPAAAIVVSMLILHVGIKLLRPAVAELVERSLPDSEDQQIEDIIRAEPGVEDPHNLRTRRIGNYRAIDVHFRMHPDTPLRLTHAATRHIEERLRQCFGQQTIICTHVEPFKPNQQP